MLVRLLQWNILFKENIQDIISTIQTINPDIVNLQELTIESKHHSPIIETPKYIGERLDFNYYFHEAHQWDEGFEMQAIGNGIFTRFPIETSTFSYVKKNRERSLIPTEEDRVYVESVIKVQGKLLTVGNVHLSYTDRFEETIEKKQETDTLIEILEDKKEKFIFSGDLNATPNSYTVTNINKYLKHCGPSFDESTWTTKSFTHGGFKEDKLRWRLDYVFATEDIRVRESKLIHVQYSDHLPILVSFEIS